MRKLALIAPVLLAGCADLPQWHSENDVREIAADEARKPRPGQVSAAALSDTVADIRERLDKAEEKIDDLEYENRQLKYEISTLN